MSIHEKIEKLTRRLASGQQYPTQGATLFIDLAARTVTRAWIPLSIAERFLGGRGVNMFLLYNLLDETLEPMSEETPLIFGSGILTSLLPSASRGNVTSWSPESGVILDSNAGDYFPSFMKLGGIDHIVLYGRARSLTMLKIERGEVEFQDASRWAGLDNIDFRQRISEEHGKEGRDFGLASITKAGENLVLCSGIMAGPKSIWARGGPGAKMGSLNLKAILLKGRGHDLTPRVPHKGTNRDIAMKLLGTSVVKNALKTRGTPFLYKPSRMMSAMGTKNNMETTWTDALDAENIDDYRPGMVGCFACPVNCRPLNDLTGVSGIKQDRYVKGDGPEYVTLGKFGPNVGISEVTDVLRLNNICNDLGLDTSSTGSAIAWAMELWEKGLIDAEKVGDLDLSWGNAESIERLLFMTAARQGFGNVIADSTRAVEKGHYPEEALDSLMAVKGLAQSDPHDARILKAFALGLAVATRGMDHLRNRVTLEINAKINDDAEFKRKLYWGEVSSEPNSYDGKEIGVRRCENIYGVGDSVGMCRFTTKLFNSPSLPGYEEFSAQLSNVAGIEKSVEDLDHIGLEINAVERLINARLGVRRAADTLPRRWFEEPIETGPFAGELIDRAEFDAMLDRYYEVSGYTNEGLPVPEWRSELEQVLGA